MLTVLGIEHLRYKLINARIMVDGKFLDTYLCVSENFRERGEEKLALDAYFDIEKLPNETPLEFCIRNGWEQYIYKMGCPGQNIDNPVKRGKLNPVKNTAKDKLFLKSDILKRKWN